MILETTLVYLVEHISTYRFIFYFPSDNYFLETLNGEDFMVK